MNIANLFKMRRLRLALVSLSAAAIIGASFVVFHKSSGDAALQQPHLAALAQLQTQEARFDVSILQGKPVAVFFGFTHCPDVCPMTLQRLALMRKQIGARFDEITVIFITLDPERDSAAQLKEYLGAQPLKVTGLTGSHDDVTRAATKFGVYQERVATSADDYTIDHTASLFLISRDGKRAGEIAIDATEAEFAAKLRSII